jgi:Cd2+/Zn2+-exporting ATPase
MTVAAVQIDGTVHGLLGFSDTIRPDAAAAVAELGRSGVRTVIASGDTQQTADAVARAVGIDEAYGALLPENKLSLLERLQRRGATVAMVGDGINDTPALTTADIGIAMGAAGSDIAIESADIALLTDDLRKVAEATLLSRATLRNIRQNVVIALLTVAALLAGVLFGAVHMASGMLVHELSVLVVTLNGMRLLARRGPRTASGLTGTGG